MQAVIAFNICNKNGGSIPVCTERKATGEYVLACFLFATMRYSDLPFIVYAHVAQPIFDATRQFTDIHFEDSSPTDLKTVHRQCSEV